MSEYRPYVVKQGDYLAKLAQIYGFEIMTVWNHPLNAELKAKRGSPDILYPGDILHIPMADPEPKGLRLYMQKGNRYVATVPAVPLNLVFGHGDAPLGNATCHVWGLPGTSAEQPLVRTTDGNGRLELQIPPLISRLDVHFPDKDLRFPVHVGEMDPIDEPRGVAKRLANLAYLTSSLAYGSECPEETLAQALAGFQRDHQLEPTGSMNEPTRVALIDAHGS